MKYKYFLFFLFVILIYGCSASKVINKNEILIKSVNSKEFEKCFRVSERNNDNIIVYINFNEFIGCPSFKLDCGKTIIFEKSDFKINPNAYNPEKRIILYDFKQAKAKNKYKFSFIDFPSNHNLILTLNKYSEVIDFECGVF